MVDPEFVSICLAPGVLPEDGVHSKHNFKMKDINQGASESKGEGRMGAGVEGKVTQRN